VLRWGDCELNPQPKTFGAKSRSHAQREAFGGSIISIQTLLPRLFLHLLQQRLDQICSTAADYLLVTFVPFSRDAGAVRMYVASGQRESATNRLGEHGGMGFGPMRQKCKRSP